MGSRVMPVLSKRRANGRALVVSSSGSLPSQVGNLALGAPSSTAIPVTYAAASGAAPITYTGFTAPHGTTNWTPNAGSFGSAGGTFTGLAAGTVYDLRIDASNSDGSSTAVYASGASTSAAAATSFTLALGAANGNAGASVQLIASPSGSAWPSGEVITPSVTGLAGLFDNASLTGAGTAPVTFNFTPVSGPGASGSFSATAPGMANSSGAQRYAVNAVATSALANRFDMVFSAEHDAVRRGQNDHPIAQRRLARIGQYCALADQGERRVLPERHNRRARRVNQPDHCRLQPGRRRRARDNRDEHERAA